MADLMAMNMHHIQTVILTVTSLMVEVVAVVVAAVPVMVEALTVVVTEATAVTMVTVKVASISILLWRRYLLSFLSSRYCYMYSSLFLSDV
jgi:hypothetical protein